MIEIGIDEAGYGPLLGPLVVTAWGVHRNDDDDLWDSLEAAVCRTPRRGRIVVADSKQVYSRRIGLKRLEESVLSFLSASGVELTSYHELLRSVVPPDILDPPVMWCNPRRVEIPLEVDRGTLDKRAFLLDSVLAGCRMKPAFVSSRVVSPRRFNESIASTGNKQVTLFSHVASLIRDATSRLGRRLKRVTVDKLGSTRRYAPLLERFFDGWSVQPESEERHRSTYRVSHPDGAFDLGFVRQGDKTEFLVALASMQSKYLRELEMCAFNLFWRRRAPHVAPTAGYYTDGKRFLRQIGPTARKAGIAEKDFVRVR